MNTLSIYLMSISYHHLFLGLFASLVALGPGEALGQSYQQGLRLLEKEQNQRAKQLLRTLVEQEPQQAEGYFYTGIAYLRSQQADSAKIFFQKETELDPKSALSQVGLGYWHQQQGQPAEAAAAFEKALQVSKGKDAKVLRWLVEAKLEQPRPDAVEVQTLLEKALKLDEKNPVLHLLQGDAYLAQNKGGEAVSSYEKAFALDATYALAQLKIGKLYTRTKNYPVAMEHLKKALEVDPAFAPAHQELGEVYFQLRQVKEAAAHYEKFVALTEAKHQARMRGGYFMYLAKEYAKASQLFEEVLKQEPRAVLILKYHAYSLLEAEQLAQAQEAFGRYFSVAAKEELEVHDFEKWGRLQQKMQQDSAAIIAYKVVLQKMPQHPEALQALGELYFKTKKFTFSAHAYEQLVQVRKQAMPQDYFALGKAHYFASDYVQADSAFSKLLELQPQLVASSLWKARTMASQDPDSEKGLAKPFYEKVIEKAVADPARYKNELKEAYSYLGYYHYLRSEIAASKDYWVKVKTLDPQDAKATSALNALMP